MVSTQIFNFIANKVLQCTRQFSFCCYFSFSAPTTGHFCASPIPRFRRRGMILLCICVSVDPSFGPSVRLSYTTINNYSLVWLSLFKLHTDIGHREQIIPIDLGVNGVKVKVIVTFNIGC